MDDDDSSSAASPSAATCHIERRRVEPPSGRAEQIAKLFGVKLPSNRAGAVGATEAPFRQCSSPRGSNASEPLLVPPILPDEGGGGSQADTMCEIAVQVSRVRDDVVLPFSSSSPPTAPPERSSSAWRQARSMDTPQFISLWRISQARMAGSFLQLSQ